GQAVDAHDAVGHGGDRALVARLGGQLDLLDAALDQFADFRGVELGACHFRFLGARQRWWCAVSGSCGGAAARGRRHLGAYWLSADCRRASLPRSEPSMTTSPALMTAPPMRAASTAVSTSTALPKRRSSPARMPASSASDSSAAEVTVARTTFSASARRSS